MKAKLLRAAMAWIHTWLGQLAGWILFAMFLTGTASFYRPEITRWMQPELRPASVGQPRAAETAVEFLQATGADDEQWTIYLPDGRLTTTRLLERVKAGAPRKPEIRLDPATGATLAARETRGGEHFYRFHFQLQLPHPWGRWLAGLCAMFMLAAIFSGVIAHKRIFADFFTLRWGKGQRSWLDAHNVSAVLALPFHAMITYTGLITLAAMYMPWPVSANYAAPAHYTAEAFGTPVERKATGIAAPLVPVAPLVAAAVAEWGGRVGTVTVRHPNDQAATITITRHGGDTLNARGRSITYSGTTGDRLSASPAPGPAVATAGVMLGLHMGWFADPLLRWIYFMLGLAGSVMVATGLVLWTVKRRERGMADTIGFRASERLNIGAIACLPAGMAAFLLANRLLPADLAGRAAMEVAAMYWAWFGLAALSLLRPVRRAWIETLSISALAFAGIPLINAATTDRGLIASIVGGDVLFIAMDVCCLASAAVLGFAAWRVARRQAAPRRRHDTVTQQVVRDAA